jgi:hypothetical protein
VDGLVINWVHFWYRMREVFSQVVFYYYRKLYFLNIQDKVENNKKYLKMN